MAQYKQRVEIAQPSRIAPLAGTPDKTPDVEVIDRKPGEVTWIDQAKKYYHALFAAVSAVLVLLVDVAPELTPLTDQLPEKWRHGITAAVVIGNAILIRFKSNQVWTPAPPPAAPRDS